MTALFLLALLAPQQAANVPRHDVTGTVTNAATGEPINHALVRCGSGQFKSALTGPDGRFEFPDMPEGQINFTVVKPGFFDANGRSSGPQAQIYRLTASKTDFPLKLSPAARVTGRLTDEDGEGIEQTTVQLLIESVSNGRKSWQTRSATSTDDDGYYVLDDLFPGRYALFAAGHLIPDSNWDGHPHVFAPAYYPGATEMSSAQLLDLQAGQEYRADLRLHSERAYRVSGTFSGVPASMGIGAWISDAAGQQAQWPLQIDQPHGRFVTALPAGTWNIHVQVNETNTQFWRATQEVVVSDSDIGNVQVTLRAPISIPLVINHPAEGPANQFFFVTLVSVDPLNPRRYTPIAVGDPPARSFDVDAGKYRIDVPVVNNECIESAWYGNTDVLRNDLVVAEGSGAQPITINMRNDCAVLSPKMEGGGTAIVVEDGVNLPPVIVQAGAKVTVAPGTYHVYAFTSINDLEYANPEVMRDFSSQEIELTPNQNLDLTLKPIERNDK